ncbi:50S ribosomal protein L10 [Pectinatus cerevisiiphilus]|uniref:Large ribosomal subunit protein uL10 n=1 Tax=Pectinatus cerevisiiphilus TaxID=86956 RepID=A0A4V2URA8_9FIRM|nr:50S ribosomal protein L10 [Pectinatus cerevisiiphilus]TCS75942.1 LSU ribosomal protein L10P [Pectinatus cerevisiiphilus]
MAVRPEKQAVVAELKESFASAKGIVLTGYKGLTVAQDTKLRAKMREAGVKYRVVKNTMLRFAVKDLGYDDLVQYLEGTTAVAYSSEDVIAPAKVIEAFIKENNLTKTDTLVVKAGVVDGKVIDAAGVKELASLPSREVLIAKLLGSMQAPISGVVNVLQGTIRNAVYVLEAIRKQKESA